MSKPSFKVAIAQLASPHLNLNACIEMSLSAVEEAATNGARLVVFGETWFSGYPAWIDHCPEIGIWDNEPMKKVFARMVENAITKDGKAINLLKKKAAEHSISIVFGANEYDQKRAKGTLYNSLFSINELGQVVNHHRKLVPTFTEKLLYGSGMVKD